MTPGQAALAEAAALEAARVYGTPCREWHSEYAKPPLAGAGPAVLHDLTELVNAVVPAEYSGTRPARQVAAHHLSTVDNQPSTVDRPVDTPAGEVA